MSIQGIYAGALETPQFTALTDTASTAVFTVSASDTNIYVLAGVTAVSTHGSSVDISLYFDNGTSESLFGKAEVNPDHVFQDRPIQLRAGQSIKAQASVANVMTVYPIIMRQMSNQALGNGGGPFG